MTTELNKNQIDAASTELEIPATYPGNPIFTELHNAATVLLATIQKIPASMKTTTDNGRVTKFIDEATQSVGESYFWASKALHSAVKGGGIPNNA